MRRFNDMDIFDGMKISETLRTVFVLFAYFIPQKMT